MHGGPSPGGRQELAGELHLGSSVDRGRGSALVGWHCTYFSATTTPLVMLSRSLYSRRTRLPLYSAFDEPLTRRLFDCFRLARGFLEYFRRLNLCAAQSMWIRASFRPHAWLSGTFVPASRETAATDVLG
jgi:hypothetical protein